MKIYDLAIIGGGINGTSVARDATGRGIQTCLIEQTDIGWATSSSSTKLLHGGLRYLEQYDFRLVREALHERDVIFRNAPHISWRMRFVLPVSKYSRPAWMLQIGLFLYDHLAKLEKIALSSKINLKKHIAGIPLKSNSSKGFEYSDLGVLDTKFALYNAIDAKEKGADIFLHTKCISAKRFSENKAIWELVLENKDTKETSKLYAKTLVNASGPWINNVIEDCIETKVSGRIRMVQGSHIIVPKLYDNPYCYILQNSDKRIIFAIPYETNYTMIGTTDYDYTGDPGKCYCTDTEKEYLCNAINVHFKTQIQPNDIVYNFAGIRPLLYEPDKPAQKISRDYTTSVEGIHNQEAVVLHLFGGKITAGREIGEKIVNQLAKICNWSHETWTENAPLPGGDIPNQDFDGFIYELSKNFPNLPYDLLHHYARHYGTRCKDFLTNVTQLTDLGIHFGAKLYEKEVRYMVQHEWARSLNSVIYRRTRQGFQMTNAEKENLEKWLEKNNK